MLKKFGFENSYSFDGWVELDMTADLSEDLDAGNHYYPKMIELFDRVRMREHGDEVGVLPVAAFYGKNAGGKTNIIKALRDMAADVLGDYPRPWSRPFFTTPFEIIYNRRCFVVNKPQNDRPIKYLICVVINNIEYTLGYSLNKHGVIDEKLVRRMIPGGADEMLYKREGRSITKGEDADLHGLIDVMESRMDDGLFFPLIALSDEKLKLFNEWFRFVAMGKQINESDKKQQEKELGAIANRIADKKDEPFRERLLYFLQCMDDSIYDLGTITKNKIPELIIFHRSKLTSKIYLDAVKKQFANIWIKFAKNYDDAPEDFEQAFDWVNSKARDGDVEAHRILGEMYREGIGVTQNYKKAVEHFRIAADKGNLDAQRLLGAMYGDGEGAPRDSKQAFKWYLKAAKEGDAGAQVSLGFMYSRGLGIDRDVKKAVKWYRKSAEQGDACAQFNLGIMYDDGRGIEQNYENAAIWYRKSAEQGNALAQLNVGYKYEHGEGVDKDITKAASWYRKSAEQGSWQAQDNLSIVYRYGRGVERDIEQADKWKDMYDKQRAIENGDEYDVVYWHANRAIQIDDGEAVLARYQTAAGLSLARASEGTRKLIEMFQMIDTVLQKGMVFVYDELDKTLHPIAFREIVRHFMSLEKNANNAQLIFSAHDTIVLDCSLLRRDCVYVIEKDEFSSSKIKRLSELTDVAYPDMENDFRKGYYGSSPNVYNKSFFSTKEDKDGEPNA